jgi:hypothetical protein
LRSAFLDTVGLLALWDDDDQWHAPAKEAFEKIVSGNQPMVTTSFVLPECGNAAARTRYRLEPFHLSELLKRTGSLVSPSDQDWDEAWQAYGRGEAGNAGIVDHVSFAVMRRLGITDAFTNDRHFRAAGFTALF